jgi:mono/diheme cytochrome c family protein
MTLYLLFAAVGILIYIGAAVAAAFSGANDVHAAVGLQFALSATVSLVLSAVITFYATRLVRAHVLIAALVFGGAVTIAIAATREPNEAPSAIATNESPAVVVAAELARAQAAGERLFQDLGCIGCHRPDGKGIGPSLIGVFGRPVTDSGCGVLTVDEEYVRESILNPSATVAAGFMPVMPTFAGRVTEEQLRALIAYVRSLKGKTP